MDLQHSLEQATGIPFSEGNQVEILKNGNAIFESMLSHIRKAKHSIDFLTFVYWKGEIAETFAGTLAQKAEEGLKVRILLDSYGALPMPPHVVEILESSPAEVVWFRPLVRWKIWKSDNRTHRKILVCDNEVAFTGGIGIAEEWQGDARNPNEWRDTHFKITGPAVKGIKAGFVENWIEAGHLVSDFLEEEPKVHDDSGGVKVQTICTSSSVRWSNIMLLYQSLINLAERNIKIVTAYFNPDQTLIRLLSEAAEREVEIDIIIPGKYTDQRVTKVAAEDKFRKLLSAGINIYYYQKTMMHAKIILIDGEVCCVGSANFNQRSMLKDDEINLVILDKEITGILEDHFKEDLVYCEAVTRHRWKRRSLLRRALEVLVKPFKQQL